MMRGIAVLMNVVSIAQNYSSPFKTAKVISMKEGPQPAA